MICNRNCYMSETRKMKWGKGSHFSSAFISQKRRWRALNYFVRIRDLDSQALLRIIPDAVEIMWILSRISGKTMVPLLNYFDQPFHSINSPCLANIRRQLLHVRVVASEAKNCCVILPDIWVARGSLTPPNSYKCTRLPTLCKTRL